MLREDTPIALPFIYINLWNLYAWQHPAAWEMHPFLGALPFHIRPYRVHAPSLPGNFLRSLTFTYVQTIFDWSFHFDSHYNLTRQMIGPFKVLLHIHGNHSHNRDQWCQWCEHRTNETSIFFNWFLFMTSRYCLSNCKTRFNRPSVSPVELRNLWQRCMVEF